MVRDCKGFVGQLVHMGDECTYYDIPILKSLDTMQFVDSFISLCPVEQKLITLIFDKRYDFKNKCEDELEWLVTINKLLKQKQESLKGQLSGFRIGRYRVSLKNAIKKIKERDSEVVNNS